MKITEIHTNPLGNIEVGVAQWNLGGEPTVESIEYSEKYDTHFVSFEGTSKTLEVFDVNYVIRDEE